METGSLTFSFFLIFSGAAVLATLALYSRQPLLIAYILLGALIGPFGAGLVQDVRLLSDAAHIGIIFLLFLLGLDMQPRALLATMRNATVVAVFSALLFAAAGYALCRAFGYGQTESLIVGATMVFSSTIIGIKLLPTTVLHHRHTGELMVGLLLLQDLMAIFVLVLLMGASDGQVDFALILRSLLLLPLFVLGAFWTVRFLLVRLIERYDRFHEYIFLLAIGWCLGLAELGALLGLSSEIGAFLAGISIASSPIAQYIATSLRPLRDFFLVLFFFTLGARFDFSILGDIWLEALLMSVLMLVLKPVTFRLMLGRLSESPKLAWDIGLRLGQISEFSLLIAYLAAANALIGKEAAHLIKATAIVTFVVSSYIVVFNCTNPIAVSDRLRRD
jgi:Kef-type K+ transport system membrane component KefB